MLDNILKPNWKVIIIDFVCATLDFYFYFAENVAQGSIFIFIIGVIMSILFGFHLAAFLYSKLFNEWYTAITDLKNETKDLYNLCRELANKSKE